MEQHYRDCNVHAKVCALAGKGACTLGRLLCGTMCMPAASLHMHTVPAWCSPLCVSFCAREGDMAQVTAVGSCALVEFVCWYSLHCELRSGCPRILEWCQLGAQGCGTGAATCSAGLCACLCHERQTVTNSHTLTCRTSRCWCSESSWWPHQPRCLSTATTTAHRTGQAMWSSMGTSCRWAHRRAHPEAPARWLTCCLRRCSMSPGGAAAAGAHNLLTWESRQQCCDTAVAVLRLAACGTQTACQGSRAPTFTPSACSPLCGPYSTLIS